MKELLLSIPGYIDGFTITMIALAIAVSLIFSPTRAVVAFLFKGLLKAISKIGGVLFTAIHEGGSSVIGAHILYFHNWLPRNAIIPSVRVEHSTRRL